jgi:hypothetical protein
MVETQQAEHSLDSWGSTEHVEPRRTRAKSRSPTHEHPDACGVDEAQTAEIEQNLLGVLCFDPVELLTETRRRRYVQVTEDLDQMCRPFTLAADRER